MRGLKIVSLNGLAGAIAGCLYGLWYCYRMHADNPAAVFSLADSVYYVTTALIGFVLGLLIGGVWAFVRSQTKSSGDTHEAT